MKEDHVRALIQADDKLVADAARACDLAGEANDPASQDLRIGRIPLHQKTITTKGQVVIPLRLRKLFHIEDGTRTIVTATEQGILLQPVTRHAINRLRGILRRKPGEVAALLEKAGVRDTPLHMTEANYAEVKYMVLRKDGAERWAEVARDLPTLPLEFHPIDRELADVAAELKSRLSFSLADAFAGALPKPP